MIVVVPASLLAQESAPGAAQSSSRAILHTDGGAWLNGSPAADSTALFPHDVVQSRDSQATKIDAEGSTVMLQPQTVLQFEGDEFVLDHGRLQVSTSRGLRVRVNCITIMPRTAEWTRYDVTDVDGKLVVVAEQSDVQIQSAGFAAKPSKAMAPSNVTLHAGEQFTRDDNCGAKPKTGDVVDAKAAILNSIGAKIAGGAVIVAITCYALCRSGEPISPHEP